jgi:hypothetical protein
MHAGGHSLDLTGPTYRSVPLRNDIHFEFEFHIAFRKTGSHETGGRI